MSAVISMEEDKHKAELENNKSTAENGKDSSNDKTHTGDRMETDQEGNFSQTMARAYLYLSYS